MPVEHTTETDPTTQVVAQSPPRRRPHDHRKYHDKAEVDAALSALTGIQIKRLIAFGRVRVVGISGRNGDTDAEDLFAEAALLTLQVKRRWRRGISLFNHLAATMRSIGDHRFEDVYKYAPISDSFPAPTIPSSAVDAESNISALEEALQNDSIALKVLETMNSRTPARDAQEELGISPGVYWSARKRIRRRMKALCDSSGEENASA